jgi:hypothetical protein
MSINIKLNPYFLSGKWNTEILDMLISAYGATPPSTNQIANSIATYVNYTYLYNASETCYLKRIPNYDIAAFSINELTNDSWCKDCCDNTFRAYEEMKNRINDMGIFSPEQLNYINQMLAMPCNYNITNTDHFEPMLNQLETTILIDKDLSQNDKNPVLLFLSISLYNYRYWKIQTDNPGSSSWNPLFTPLAASEYLRPFWLAGLLGAIVCVEREINKAITTLSDDCVNISVLGFIGASAASTAYAYYK